MSCVPPTQKTSSSNHRESSLISGKEFEVGTEVLRVWGRGNPVCFQSTSCRETDRNRGPVCCPFAKAATKIVLFKNVGQCLFHVAINPYHNIRSQQMLNERIEQGFRQQKTTLIGHEPQRDLNGLKVTRS